MTRPEFADDVLALLRRYRVSASRACLELTEGTLVAEPDLARTMQRLADNGMSVVLDDFGAGFSSLSYVHQYQYQFTGLKIDKSFISSNSRRARVAARSYARSCGWRNRSTYCAKWARHRHKAISSTSPCRSMRSRVQRLHRARRPARFSKAFRPSKAK